MVKQTSTLPILYVRIGQVQRSQLLRLPTSLLYQILLETSPEDSIIDLYSIHRVSQAVLKLSNLLVFHNLWSKT